MVEQRVVHWVVHWVVHSVHQLVAQMVPYLVLTRADQMVVHLEELLVVRKVVRLVSDLVVH